MRGMLGVVGLLVALAVVGLAAKQMLSRPTRSAVSGGEPAVVTAVETPRATTDRVKADLEQALRDGATRASEADR